MQISPSTYKHFKRLYITSVSNIWIRDKDVDKLLATLNIEPPNILQECLKVNLHQFRKNKRFSLEALAKETGISKGYLWQLENEDGKQPSGEILYKLAWALETTMENLMGKRTLTDGTRKENM